MLKIILICLSLLLSGISIGISIAQFIFRKEFEFYEKYQDKYINVLDWIRRIPQACWYNDEFLKHVEELTNSFKESEDDHA